jgi:hypothetical protein
MLNFQLIATYHAVLIQQNREFIPAILELFPSLSYRHSLRRYRSVFQKAIRCLDTDQCGKEAKQVRTKRYLDLSIIQKKIDS